MLSSPKTRFIALALGTALWMGCPVATGTCESNTCPTGQFCDLQTHLCVLGDILSITSPDGGPLDGGSLLLAGRVKLDAGTAASYRTQDAGDWVDLPLDSAGTFQTTLSLPALDGQTFLIEVRASHYGAAVSSVVDNVAPTGAFSTPADLSLHPGVLSLSFSEPVVVEQNTWLAVSPGLSNAAWSGDGKSYSGSLPHGSYIRGEVVPSQVHDLFGNPLQGHPVTSFFSEPATPATGQLLASNDWIVESLEAISDAQGWISFAVRAHPDAGGPSFASWQIIDPTSGQLHEQVNIPSTGGFINVDGASTLDAGNPPTELHGYSFHQHNGDPTVTNLGTTAWKLGTDGATYTGASLIGLIATPPGCGESTVAPGVGQVYTSAIGTGDTTLYSRDNGAHIVTLPMRAFWVGTQSAEHWVLFGQSGNNLMRGNFDRTCSAPQQWRPSLANGLRTDLKTGNSDFSFAVTDSGRFLIVYDNTTPTRMEVCYPCMLDPLGTSTCPGEGLRPADGVSLHVNPRHDGNRVLGTRFNVTSGLLELVERDLSDCQSSWQVLATVPNSAGLSAARPLMFGLAPGALYVRSGGLYVYRQ